MDRTEFLEMLTSCIQNRYIEFDVDSDWYGDTKTRYLNIKITTDSYDNDKTLYYDRLCSL